MKRRAFLKHMGLASAAVAAGARIAIEPNRAGKSYFGTSVSNALTLEDIRRIKDELAWRELQGGTHVVYADPRFREDLKSIPNRAGMTYQPDRFYRKTNVMPPRGRWA